MSSRGRPRGGGKGLALPLQETAEVRFSPDGSIPVGIGTMSGGQGHETAYTQIVAGALGVRPDTVRIIQGDTDAVAHGQGSGGSRSLAVGGSALKGAGEAGTVGAPPAVMNAIVDALASLGVRHIDMPATPERVWRAIQVASNRQEVSTPIGIARR